MSNLIISSTPNAIVAVDRDLNIVPVNPRSNRSFVSARSHAWAACRVVMDPEPFARYSRPGADVH